ncbi:hypothetical protein LR48_Vigan01g140500 [Vigna angularis]|uniref:Uncharacterized protein n=1 Tax=Phaseolus angularis TaxID=3914 RepID=A0A0L9TNV7_PHAAN|nr:hypothetical protein LR48_Vigan01g140500 [Vigna angularis]
MSIVRLSLFEKPFGWKGRGYANNVTSSSSSLGSLFWIQESTEQSVSFINISATDVNTNVENEGKAPKELAQGETIEVEVDAVGEGVVPSSKSDWWDEGKMKKDKKIRYDEKFSSTRSPKRSHRGDETLAPLAGRIFGAEFRVSNKVSFNLNSVEKELVNGLLLVMAHVGYSKGKEDMSVRLTKLIEEEKRLELVVKRTRSGWLS